MPSPQGPRPIRPAQSCLGVGQPSSGGRVCGALRSLSEVRTCRRLPRPRRRCSSPITRRRTSRIHYDDEFEGPSLLRNFSNSRRTLQSPDVVFFAIRLDQPVEEGIYDCIVNPQQSAVSGSAATGGDDAWGSASPSSRRESRRRGRRGFRFGGATDDARGGDPRRPCYPPHTRGIEPRMLPGWNCSVSSRRAAASSEGFPR